MTTTSAADLTENPTPPVTSPRSRLAGVDVARAVALLGMVTVHFGPGRDVGEGAAAFVYHSFYGKASVLFALVAGIGVGLMTQREPTARVRARLVYRFTWLVPTGLALQALDHPIAVILQYYGLFFLGAIPFVGRRRRTLLASSLALLLAGSAVVLWALVVHPEWMVRRGGQAPVAPLGELVLGGYYPAVTWVPVVVFGMWLAELDLHAHRTRLVLVLAGVGTLAATRWVGMALADAAGAEVTRESWGWGLSVTGHSEMPLAVVGAMAFGVAVLGVALAVADRLPRLSHPLAALGRLALTVYVGHIIVYALVPDLFPAATVAEGITHVAWFGVATAAMATLWLAIWPRGPLEAVVRWPFRHAVVPLLELVEDPTGRFRGPP